jgi:hypothetical protein
MKLINDLEYDGKRLLDREEYRKMAMECANLIFQYAKKSVCPMDTKDEKAIITWYVCRQMEAWVFVVSV